jgi:hypothetical protein
VNCFNLFFDCSRGGGTLLFIYFHFLLLLWGWRLMFFFLHHLTCGRWRGNELVFFLKFFFSVLSG